MKAKNIVASAVTAMMVGAMLYHPIVVKAGELSEFVYPNSDALNGVLDYGIFATNKYTVNNDVEANFAANTVDFASVHNVGISNDTSWMYTNGYTDVNLYYFNDADNIDNYVGGQSALDSKYYPTMLLGTGTTYTKQGSNITLTSNGKSVTKSITDMRISDIKYAKQTKYTIDFSQAAKGLADFSTKQYGKTDDGATKAVDTNDSNRINITCKAGDDIINIKYDDFIKSNARYYIAGENGTTNYSLILNITDLPATDITLDTPVYIDGKSYDEAPKSSESSRLLYNFGTSYVLKVNLVKTQLGNVLAPNASVVIESASHNGSVFAKNVTHNNCEIHQSYFRMMHSTVSTSISFTKTVDGNVPLDTEKFTFNLEEGSLDTTGNYQSSSPVKIISTIQNTLGNIVFSQAYTVKGTYYYKVYETVPPGYHSDSVFYVKVAVDITANTATTTVYSDDGFTTEVAEGSRVFKNIKDGTTAPSYGKVTILKNGADGPKLAGAHYKIFKTASASRMYYIAPTVNGTAAAWTADASAATVLETNDQGAAYAQGFEAGDYSILEVYPAPRGYQIDSTPITFTITAEEAATQSSASVSTHQIDQLITPDGPGNNPDTGDCTNARGWFFLFGSSIAVMIGCLWMRMTKKYN